MMCKSVPHTPAPLTSMQACSASGSGVRTSRTSTQPAPAANLTSAFTGSRRARAGDVDGAGAQCGLVLGGVVLGEDRRRAAEEQCPAVVATESDGERGLVL